MKNCLSARPWALGIACVLWMAGAQAQDTGTLALSVSQHAGAPGHLYLRPEAADREKDSLIQVDAVRTGVNTGLFFATLAPGRYEIMGTRAADTGVPQVDLGIPDIGMRPLDAADAMVAVQAGQHVDLGRVWSDTLGGNLFLMLRDVDALTNEEIFPELPDAVPASGWASAVGPLEAGLVDRARHRAVTVSVPLELADGRWVSQTTGGQVLIQESLGTWRIAASLAADRLAAADVLDVGDPVLAGEFGHLYRGGDGVGRLPQGQPRHLHCTDELACAALLQRGESFVLVHSADVRSGEWKELAKVEGGVSFWSGPISVQAHEVGPETILFGGDKELIRVDVATGTVGRTALEFSAQRPLVAAGRITLREHYSDDGGRSWTTLDTRLRDGHAQFDGAGSAWATSMDIGAVTHTPVLRRSPDGLTDWADAGPLPAVGDLRVGRFSPVMYLGSHLGPYQAGGVLWMSTDQGATWTPDRSLHELVGEG